MLIIDYHQFSDNVLIISNLIILYNSRIDPQRNSMFVNIIKIYIPLIRKLNTYLLSSSWLWASACATRSSLIDRAVNGEAASLPLPAPPVLSLSLTECNSSPDNCNYKETFILRNCIKQKSNKNNYDYYYLPDLQEGILKVDLGWLKKQHIDGDVLETLTLVPSRW